MDTAFDSYNGTADSVVVLTVPHAGRAYAADVGDRLALPLVRARPLEDRYADLLPEVAIAEGFCTLVARVPRLMIDLNRDETDFTAASVAGAHRPAPRPSHRARGGLGLVPDRLGTARLWRAPIDAAELTRRVARVHRPWHLAVEAALARAAASDGRAVLLDLHSMPPLGGRSAPDVVIGDRNGSSADAEITQAAAAFFAAAGLRVAINKPYAGAYMLDRHGNPGRGISALQIELDRRLYLDAALDRPGHGLRPMQALIAALANRIATLARPAGWLLAAE